MYLDWEIWGIGLLVLNRRKEEGRKEGGRGSRGRQCVCRSGVENLKPKRFTVRMQQNTTSALQSSVKRKFTSHKATMSARDRQEIRNEISKILLQVRHTIISASIRSHLCLLLTPTVYSLPQIDELEKLITDFDGNNDLLHTKLYVLLVFLSLLHCSIHLLTHSFTQFPLLFTPNKVMNT